ncbi:hypothetical protein D9758_007592 [Tetrapyrgos nigripes]|uniref:Uncharacterized protein n=1 Tax=Tetrapyrgos nigripes TaxID=182062 RepID=A0A8H5G7T7_9AGAR|nr:hypothetical protein D9758_007592 [Tetrapyrgos nigripes]
MGKSTDSFPQELIQVIVDQLKDDKPFLRDISLLSSAWCSAARTHLFTSIRLSDEADFKRCKEDFSRSSASEIVQRCIRKVTYEPGNKSFMNKIKQFTETLEQAERENGECPSMEEIFKFLTASTKESHTSVDPPDVPLPTFECAFRLDWISNLGIPVHDTPALRQFLSAFPNLRRVDLSILWSDAHAAQVFFGLCGNQLKVIRFREAQLQVDRIEAAPRSDGRATRPLPKSRVKTQRPDFDFTSVEELELDHTRAENNDYIVHDLLAHSTPTNLRILRIDGDVLTGEAFGKLLNLGNIPETLENLHIDPVWIDPRQFVLASFKYFKLTISPLFSHPPGKYGHYLPTLTKPFSSLQHLSFGLIHLVSKLKPLQTLTWVYDFISSFPSSTPASSPLKTFTLNLHVVTLPVLTEVLQSKNSERVSEETETTRTFSWKDFTLLLSKKFPNLEEFRVVFHTKDEVQLMEILFHDVPSIPKMGGLRKVEWSECYEQLL